MPEKHEDGGAPSDVEESSESAEESGEARPSSKPSGDDDAAAQRVADALGVGDDEEAEAAGEANAEEPEAAPNRAARRRDEARERRRKRRGDDSKAKADELPKDRNARAKELLLRRREQAADRRADVGANLLPGEMVDDALARMTSRTTKWFKKNFPILQWVLLAGLVAGGVALYMDHRQDKQKGAAASYLIKAFAAENGEVKPEDTRSDEEKEFDRTLIYKTADERSDAALASYNQVIDKFPGTGPAILAKMGQAGMYLQKKQWQAAADAYAAVLASPLAAADLDVKGRAIEGTGFAKEGKEDFDGALASFKELEAIDAKGFKELALYHQARMWLAKGDKEKAKELLKQAKEKLATPTADASFRHLKSVVEELMRKIDPASMPARGQLTGPRGTSMSPEELQRLFQQAQEKAAKKNAAHGDDEH